MSAIASKEPDMELKKAFMELQHKMQSTHQSIRFSDLQVTGLKRQIVTSQITDRAIKSVPEQTRLYSGIGRMFLLTDRDTMHKDLVASENRAEEKILTIENNKKYLEKSLKESENNLREMVKQKQNTVSG